VIAATPISAGQDASSQVIAHNPKTAACPPTPSERRALYEGQLALQRAMTWFEDTRLESEVNEIRHVLKRLRQLELEWECLKGEERT
jgi:hypothetical protein